MQLLKVSSAVRDGVFASRDSGVTRPIDPMMPASLRTRIARTNRERGQWMGARRERATPLQTRVEGESGWRRVEVGAWPEMGKVEREVSRGARAVDVHGAKTADGWDGWMDGWSAIDQDIVRTFKTTRGFVTWRPGCATETRYVSTFLDSDTHAHAHATSMPLHALSVRVEHARSFDIPPAHGTYQFDDERIPKTAPAVGILRLLVSKMSVDTSRESLPRVLMAILHLGLFLDIPPAHGTYQFDDERIPKTAPAVGVLRLLVSKTSVDTSRGSLPRVLTSRYCTSAYSSYPGNLIRTRTKDILHPRCLSRRTHYALGTYYGVLKSHPIFFPSAHVVVTSILVADTPTLSSEQSVRISYKSWIVVDTDKSTAVVFVAEEDAGGIDDQTEQIKKKRYTLLTNPYREFEPNIDVCNEDKIGWIVAASNVGPGV
ncbi:hypothetical protein BDN70DRAFT_938570 [Pholiota conissans]|uniref:Uncharacterized protein n=1 Tax=Pholiota conissans TaxID=109636 RepID=A0A9P5YN75_9AGAR|nr:hypothetical protein BDN70DRAFT_938570 [Pholiota conissans]